METVSAVDTTDPRRLSINLQSLEISNRSQTNNIVAESWEDEKILSEEDLQCPFSPQQPATFPVAPPPTPISPSTRFAHQNFENPFEYNKDRAVDVRSERKSTRPDKTDAIAKRLISGALNIRPPKKTEEQKAYEEAMKEKEINRRNKEKQTLIKAQEDIERAKQAIWND